MSGGEMAGAESLSRLRYENSVSAETVEPWLFSLARTMHEAIKSAEITEREEGKQEGKYGKIVES
jgi:hypothetical protein